VSGFLCLQSVYERKRERNVKSYLYRQTQNYGIEGNGFFELGTSKEK